MITISDLLDNITVQGDIRVSAWTRDEDEKVILLTECDGGLSASRLPKRWRNAEVLYMFCPGDGLLHIEVSPMIKVNYLGKDGQERMIRNGWRLMLPLGYWESNEDMHKRLSAQYSDVRIYWSGTMVRGIHSYFAMCKR